jgi:GT2 family glycosyltransferase
MSAASDPTFVARETGAESTLLMDTNPETSAPTVSVVVITRNRPRDLAVCLSSLLKQEFQDFELVVVDQSSDATSRDLVQRFAASDCRLRHIPDHGKGAARARNLGTAGTSSEIVVFTDDDCQAKPDWLASIVQSLVDDPAAGMAYGSVIPAPHDARDGFIVGFRPSHRTRLYGRLAKLRDCGISANVAVRRTALVTTGGFDEMLGPGGYFSCAEDFDLTYRVLAHGFAVLHVPEAHVLHHGLRDWQSGSALVNSTYVAIGAAYMKHVRLHDFVGLALLTNEVWLAVTNVARHLVRRKGPLGFGRLRSLLVGALRSFELPIERDYAVYTAPTPAVGDLA